MRGNSELTVTCKMLLIASSTIVMTFASFTVSMSHRGLIAPHWTQYAICSIVPPEVRLVITHTASFWLLKSPWFSNAHQTAIAKMTNSSTICWYSTGCISKNHLHVEETALNYCLHQLEYQDIFIYAVKTVHCVTNYITGHLVCWLLHLNFGATYFAVVIFKNSRHTLYSTSLNSSLTDNFRHSHGVPTQNEKLSKHDVLARIKLNIWNRCWEKMEWSVTLVMMSITGGMSPQPMTAWIWLTFPAVTFEIIHAASFWMLCFSCVSNGGNFGSDPWSITNYRQTIHSHYHLSWQHALASQ